MTEPRKLIEIAERAGTPLYAYDASLLRTTLGAAVDAAKVNSKFRIHYAMKACYEPGVLDIIREYIDSVDTVSGGEIELAVESGFTPDRIVFAGVGKTDSEIDLACRLGIEAFNVESLPELEVISERASASGTTARVCLRVNPDIDAHTHRYITTGLEENKFGINLTMLDRAVDMALALPGVVFDGLHFHIGSQITINEPFRILCERANDIVAALRNRGIAVNTLNVGGGLGVDYERPLENPVPPFKAYFHTFADHLDTSAVNEVRFELGRSLTAQCGTLLARVLYVKQGYKRKYVIADAGMTDLLRPALYGARHAITNLSGETRGESRETVDVVGPVCESSDTFGGDFELARPRRGDIIAIHSAGAYGATMSSAYNRRRSAGSVMTE